MKTTLKRGIGRGAEVNGNGRAVIPPGTLSPVTLYRQPPPSKPGFAKVVGKFFLWLVVLARDPRLRARRRLLPLGAREREGARLQLASAASARSRGSTRSRTRTTPAVALVIGYDHRAGDGNSPSRSDTMMLIRADPVTKTISLLSFPRDLIVPIYCPSRTPAVRAPGRRRRPAPGGSTRAYAYCGASGALETVQAPDGRPDQLPDQRQLPRVHRGRRTSSAASGWTSTGATTTRTSARARPTSRTSTSSPATSC